MLAAGAHLGARCAQLVGHLVSVGSRGVACRGSADNHRVPHRGAGQRHPARPRCQRHVDRLWPHQRRHPPHDNCDGARRRPGRRRARPAGRRFRPPVERQVRHASETASAYSARNRRDDALGVLLNAEQLAPEQIKHHAISRQLVLSWLRNHRGPRSVPLDELARRLHLV